MHVVARCGPVRRGGLRPPGRRSATASSPRRCPGCARSTSRRGWSGCWPGCAGWRRRPPTSLGRRRGRPAQLARRDRAGLDDYSAAFVGAHPAAAGGRAAARRGSPSATSSAICRTGRSPLTHRPIRRGGRLGRWLRAIVVSQRVGTIKPHPTIFRVAEAALGTPPAGDPPRRRRLGGRRRRREARRLARRLAARPPGRLAAARRASRPTTSSRTSCSTGWPTSRRARGEPA